MVVDSSVVDKASVASTVSASQFLPFVITIERRLPLFLMLIKNFMVMTLVAVTAKERIQLLNELSSTAFYQCEFNHYFLSITSCCS